MALTEEIKAKIQKNLDAYYIEVLNESMNHNVPADAETHFRVTIVSEDFGSLMPVKRHQKVYDILDDEIHSKVHALALHTFTKEEWDRAGHQIPESAPCAHREN